MDWKIFPITAAISLTGCSTSQTAVTNNPSRSCNDLTNDGELLCHALNQTDSEANRVGGMSNKLDNKKFDYALIGLGILSTAALAADMHASVLEGLGITTAATVGIKTYNNISDRIGIYSQAQNSLLCLETAAESALVYDEKMAQLKTYTENLSEARSLIPTYVNVSNITISTLTPTLAALETQSKAAVDLGNAAIVSYAIVDDIVEVMTRDIIAAMNLSIENKRDISSIISNIEASARQQQSEAETTSDQEDTTNEALENTQDPAVNAGLKQQAFNLLNSSRSDLRNNFLAIQTDNDKAIALIIALRESMTFIKDYAPQIQNAVTNVKACKKN